MTPSPGATAGRQGRAGNALVEQPDCLPFSPVRDGPGRRSQRPWPTTSADSHLRQRGEGAALLEHAHQGVPARLQGYAPGRVGAWRTREAD